MVARDAQRRACRHAMSNQTDRPRRSPPRLGLLLPTIARGGLMAEPGPECTPAICCLRNSHVRLRAIPRASAFPGTTRKIGRIFLLASPTFHRLVYILVYIHVYTPRQRARPSNHGTAISSSMFAAPFASTRFHVHRYSARNRACHGSWESTVAAFCYHTGLSRCAGPPPPLSEPHNSQDLPLSLPILTFAVVPVARRSLAPPGYETGSSQEAYIE